MIFTFLVQSPMGEITMASDGEAITGLWLENQKYCCAGLSASAALQHLPVFDQAAEWLSIYFSGEDPGFTPRLHLYGTDFRISVWKLLMEIPYGQTVSYSHLAKKLAAEMGLKHMSAQAVGGAVGHNPISIIVPCHRVIGSNGSLTGYAGGVDKKLKLLQLEKADLSGLWLPQKGTAL